MFVDSVESQVAILADRKTFKVVHVARPDVTEHYDCARQEDVIVVSNVVPRIEPKPW